MNSGPRWMPLAGGLGMNASMGDRLPGPPGEAPRPDCVISRYHAIRVARKRGAVTAHPPAARSGRAGAVAQFPGDGLKAALKLGEAGAQRGQPDADPV